MLQKTVCEGSLKDLLVDGPSCIFMSLISLFSGERIMVTLSVLAASISKSLMKPCAVSGKSLFNTQKGEIFLFQVFYGPLLLHEFWLWLELICGKNLSHWICGLRIAKDFCKEGLQDAKVVSDLLHIYTFTDNMFQTVFIIDASGD